MRHKKLVEYRKQEIGRLLVLGASQSEIAKALNVAQPTVSRDITAMQESAREELKTHVERALPHVHLICNRGIDQVLKTAWGIVASSKNDYVKIHALNLIHQTYITKQNLSTDGTVINNALELIKKSKRELKNIESVTPAFGETEEAIVANIAALSRTRDAKASARLTTDTSGLAFNEDGSPLEGGAIVIAGSSSTADTDTENLGNNGENNGRDSDNSLSNTEPTTTDTIAVESIAQPSPEPGHPAESHPADDSQPANVEDNQQQHEEEDSLG
jgi:predicted transcriptional regulator